jgi:hypothetical protein
MSRLSNEEWALLKKEMEVRRKELQPYRFAYTQPQLEASRALLRKYLDVCEPLSFSLVSACVRMGSCQEKSSLR